MDDSVNNPMVQQQQQDEAMDLQQAPPPSLSLPTPMHLPEAASVAEFLASPETLKPPAAAMHEFIGDETLLTHAIKQPNVPAVRQLLIFGADPNSFSKKGVTPMSAAAYKGHLEIMHLLLAKGADVNKLNLGGSTALIQAAHFGHAEAVVILLQNNAQADFANGKGTTALMRASQEGHVEISKLLIAVRVDVNRKNHEGMSALMLASQRGHANMVVLLVKAGAAMDEQTAQGSTALMLACKRGHEKCVAELVGMGAEIHMVDGRDRNARDTALKRNHSHLLPWLNTQVQIKKIQESRRLVRCSIMSEMREAHQTDKLILAPVEQPTLLLMEEARRQIAAEKVAAGVLTIRPPSAAPLLDINALDGPSRAAFDSIKTLLGESKMAGRTLPPQLKPLQPGQADWQWPFLLYRILGMPFGVYELIADFLPTPRIWNWSLHRLKRRCTIAPYVAVTDLSTIIDEVLGDSNIFPGPDQKHLLVRINNSPEIHPYLLDVYGMPPQLLASMRLWADTQSLLSRTTEADVSFKAPFARRMLHLTAQICKWHRNRSQSVKALALVDPAADDGDNDDHDGGGGGGGGGPDACETAGEDNSVDTNLMDEDTDADQDGPGDDDLDDVLGEDDSDLEADPHPFVPGF